MAITERIYEGIAYRQSPNPEAPLLISFVAAAEDLLTWASIPRRGKLEQGQIGFQRTEDPNRVLKARDFFRKHPTNQSPTAIVLGIHPVRKTERGIVELTFLEDSNDSLIRKCRLSINIPVELEELDETLKAGATIKPQQLDELPRIIELVKSQLVYRVAQDEESVIEEEFSDSDIEEITQDDESFQEETEDQQEVELGTSLLRNFLHNLEDINWCEQNLDIIIDFAKPASVIDGQHRLMGAAACERKIPFTVCALYNCPWAEQVFQFTVVNYTAKGIPDQFITANAALSLTQSELGDLKSRFTQAGVKVLEYDLMQIVEFDERSPFYNLINLSEKKDETKIGYKTMVRVAKRWYEARLQNLQQLILPNLYPDIKGENSRAKKQRLDRWKNQDWGDFFIDFWETVYIKYKDYPSHVEDHKLWDVGYSNLIKGVVLLELQEVFFSSLNILEAKDFQAEDSIGVRRKLRERADVFLERFPVEFFGSEWRSKSLDTGAGRRDLQDALQKLYRQRGEYRFRQHSLITGETS